jgi:hypothetical protein
VGLMGTGFAWNDCSHGTTILRRSLMPWCRVAGQRYAAQTFFTLIVLLSSRRLASQTPRGTQPSSKRSDILVGHGGNTMLVDRSTFACMMSSRRVMPTWLCLIPGAEL